MNNYYKENNVKDELTIIIAGNCLVGKTCIIKMIKYFFSKLAFEIVVSREFIDKNDKEPSKEQISHLKDKTKINIIEFYYTKGYTDKNLKRYLYNKNKYLINSTARGTCISNTLDNDK